MRCYRARDPNQNSARKTWQISRCRSRHSSRGSRWNARAKAALIAPRFACLVIRDAAAVYVSACPTDAAATRVRGQRAIKRKQSEPLQSVAVDACDSSRSASSFPCGSRVQCRAQQRAPTAVVCTTGAKLGSLTQPHRSSPPQGQHISSAREPQLLRLVLTHPRAGDGDRGKRHNGCQWGGCGVTL